MRCWLWVAFLLNTVAGGVCPAGAGEARIDGNASAEILPGDVPGLRLIGRDFLRRSLYAGEGASRDFLIEIESRSELPLAETDDIAPPPLHRLMIRELSGKTIGPILRTLELAANDIRIDRLPLVEAETWGCCVQANTIALYNLLDGRLVAARSTDFDVLTATRLAPGGRGRPAIRSSPSSRSSPSTTLWSARTRPLSARSPWSGRMCRSSGSSCAWPRAIPCRASRWIG